LRENRACLAHSRIQSPFGDGEHNAPDQVPKRAENPGFAGRWSPPRIFRTTADYLVVFDLGDDPAILILPTRCLMQQCVRADEHENRLKIPPQPHSNWRDKFRQPIGEGDHN
jgi:hypothetical protein